MENTTDPSSPWYVALSLMTKRGKVVNEQDLPAPVRRLTADEIANLNYTAPKQLTDARDPPGRERNE